MRILKTIISICKDSGVEIDPKDTEGCHRLPLSRTSRGKDKRMIVKFVNRKHSEALLRDKKRISSKSFSHLNVPNKIFVSASLCHITDIYGVSATISKGKTR